jgi:3-deoxy-D-manno-octulosonic acid (KDO) 8-phosphate synthase
LLLMINKFLLATIISMTLTHCGFSPIYTGSSKQVIISKSEIIGDKDLAFNLEQRLNFKKDEKNLNAYVFKAQIYDTAESSLVDSRGISTEEIIKLTVSYQFQDKNGVIIYQDAITKDKRVSVTDNLSNNILVKNNEKRLLLDSIIQNILFKSRVSLN